MTIIQSLVVRRQVQTRVRNGKSMNLNEDKNSKIIALLYLSKTSMPMSGYEQVKVAGQNKMQ